MPTWPEQVAVTKTLVSAAGTFALALQLMITEVYAMMEASQLRTLALNRMSCACSYVVLTH